MLSAAYDGHEGTLGNGVGVHSADPSMKVVQGGMSAVSPADTVRMIALWAKEFRKDGKFPADVINDHFYCGDPERKVGLSPEECNMTGAFRNLTTLRDRCAWLTFTWPPLAVARTAFGECRT